MARVPGQIPEPVQIEFPEHHDHYLPDEVWAQVVTDAQKFRAETDESEAE